MLSKFKSYLGDLVQITWMIRQDLDQVVDIERASYTHPWGADGIAKALRLRDTIGMVIRVGEQVGGYMIYQCKPSKLHVCHFAIDPARRRTLLGSALAAKLISKLSGHRRQLITANIAESNLAGQLFAKTAGFKAMRIVPGYFGANVGDAYAFEYLADRHLRPATIENRIARFYK